MSVISPGPHPYHAYTRLVFSELGTVCKCSCGHIDVFYETGDQLTFADLKAAIASITSPGDRYLEAQSESSKPTE